MRENVSLAFVYQFLIYNAQDARAFRRSCDEG